MKRNTLLTVLATGTLLATGALAHAANSAVSPSADPATQQRDMQITETVKGKLEANDPDVARRIAVSTHDGVVTLKGIALTNDYIIKALTDARSVDGVVKVKNDLTVE
ncbi:MAG TPA: BON domain-containing protein [Steroidobacteraceae bacterium]|nr:BON domain-containing protein [Steroidobacteraceae bacterium]